MLLQGNTIEKDSFWTCKPVTVEGATGMLSALLALGLLGLSWF